MNKLWTIIVCLSCLCVMNGQQLCDGNLGDNIFTDGDFGTGDSNIILTDPQIAPGYLYHGSASSPPDGSYVITNDMSQWGFLFPTWLPIRDNSDDPKGYMMVVNASHQPGLFYQEQIDDLCDNTLYEFSADVINLVRAGVPNHIKPRLAFLINGSEEFSTGDIDQNETWQKYGFTFTTPPGQTSVTLSIRNDAPGGGGNDLALDNISFQPCGPSAFVSTDRNIFLCEEENEPATLTADITSDQALQWQQSFDGDNWQDIPGETMRTLIHDDFDVGVYYYRYRSAGSTEALMNPRCRIQSDVVVLEVLPLEWEDSVTLCHGERYDFGAQALDSTGSYVETFISSRGCDSIVTLALEIRPEEDYLLSTDIVDPSCHGFSDGSLTFEFDGVEGPYSFCLDDRTSTVPMYADLSSGSHVLRIKDQHECSRDFDIMLEDPEAFLLSLSRDTTLTLGDPLTLTASANHPTLSTVWERAGESCDNCLELTYLPLQTGPVTLTATNTDGCTATATVDIIVDKMDLPIYIPQVFAPALPAESNFMLGSLPGFVDAVVNLKIYDRWGSVVHALREVQTDILWDGRSGGQDVEVGMYTYLLELRLIDGESHLFSGGVQLIR